MAKEESYDNAHSAPAASTGDLLTGVFSSNGVSSEQKAPAKSTTIVFPPSPRCGGTHGGYFVPNGYIPYKAGTSIDKIVSNYLIHAEQFSHFNSDKIQLRLSAAFCPTQRIYPRYNEFAAQQANMNNPPPTRLPTTPLSNAARFQTGTNSAWDSTLARDSLALNIYGRGTLARAGAFSSSFTRELDALPMRAHIAIWNALICDKMTGTQELEFTTDTVTGDEFNLRFDFNRSGSLILDEGRDNIGWGIRRGRSAQSYYNDFRRSVFSNNSAVQLDTLYTHVVSQGAAAEFREQAENVNKTPAQVLAELRGTRIARENECYFIGMKTIDIDLSIQPNTSESTGSLALGADGALSYTFLKDCNILGRTFNSPQDGYIMLYYEITSASNSISSMSANEHAFGVTADSVYRKNLGQRIKDEPMLQSEVTGDPRSYSSTPGSGSDIAGWRRYGSHHFVIPHNFSGDFIDVQSSGHDSWGENRTNSNGWLAMTMQGTSVANLPSKLDWVLARNPFDSISSLSIDSARLNMVDYALRRLLLVSGDGLSNTVFRRRTPSTFMLCGNIVVHARNYPVAASIEDNYTKVGDE